MHYICCMSVVLDELFMPHDRLNWHSKREQRAFTPYSHHWFALYTRAEQEKVASADQWAACNHTLY
jgi:hypothetical protein